METKWKPVSKKTIPQKPRTPFIAISNGTMRIPVSTVRLLKDKQEAYHSLQFLISEEEGREVIGLRFLKEEAHEPETIELKRGYTPSGCLKNFYFYDRVRLRFLFGEETTLSMTSTRYEVSRDKEDPNILVIGSKNQQGGEDG